VIYNLSSHDVIYHGITRLKGAAVIFDEAEVSSNRFVWISKRPWQVTLLIAIDQLILFYILNKNFLKKKWYKLLICVLSFLVSLPINLNAYFNILTKTQIIDGIKITWN